MSNIPAGLNYTEVTRTQGVLGKYNFVFANTMALSDFYLIDDYLQVEIKNFGQASPQAFKSEAYILKLLESKSEFDCCSDFLIVPLEINGVPYTGDEIEITFASIVAMIPNGRYCDIYASTNPIAPQTPVKYKVGFSIEELWLYISTCSCPSI